MASATKRWAFGLSAILVLIVSAAGMYWFRQEQDKKAEFGDRMRPFVSAVALARQDGELALEKKGLIAPSPYPPVACGLDTCADAKSYAIAVDGTVNVVLSGRNQPALEGKTLVLSPTIANKQVTWTCKTNAPESLVMAPGDMYAKTWWPGNVNWCIRLP